MRHVLTGVIRPPELAIVTEFMELGSLHDVLHNGGANPAALNWAAAVAMLRCARSVRCVRQPMAPNQWHTVPVVIFHPHAQKPFENNSVEHQRYAWSV